MVLTRTFEAPRELVWKAWTDPAYVVRWWGPQGFTLPVCRIDFRVGGRFTLCMRTPGGEEFWGGGEYQEIAPYQRIAFAMYFADADGNRVDSAEAGIDHEAIEGAYDVVQFEDLGAGRTGLTYTGNETMESAVRSGQFEGMTQSIDKLAALLAELVESSQPSAPGGIRA